MTLRLRPLSLDDETDARAAHDELAPEGFSFLLDWDPDERWAWYLEKLHRRRHGLGIPADRVPATFLIAEVDGALVGRTSIRHRLNGHLKGGRYRTDRRDVLAGG